MKSENTSVHKGTLLVIEDDIGLQTQLKWHFSDYQVVLAVDTESAIAALRLHEPEVILQDLGLPPNEDGVTEGFKCMQQIIQLMPESKIIVITGAQDSENALKAVSLGAYDFYQKPIDTEVLDLIVSRAFQMYSLEYQIRSVRPAISTKFEGIITSNSNMLDLCRRIEKIARSDITCLLTGESGTGKELFAKAFHAQSERNQFPFIPINCAAIPESLIESELFGHEKGAFTGADKQVLGKFETAQGGTVFLDELGDMPLESQGRLLRFLQEKTIERVGGRVEIPLDVRVVCATNRNLTEMVKEGTFREDLYYRVSEFNIQVPPLRERGSDKVLLARYFLDLYSGNEDIIGFSDDAIAAIDAYVWPGNVRELESKIRQAVILREGKYITADSLGLRDSTDIVLNLRRVREEAEKKAINQAILLTEGNLSKAASRLGVSRPTLYDLIKKWKIDVKQNRS